ncbi:MinD/ParA family protein [Ectothiorhodospira variabilis]|uniref:MinD/ParA family protein n=1 Tax=Ectothiorhodospira variabilis TaxID=505694 RepID=UPI001EFA73E0|nr:MinD/ParA family protein [Ectothiorhodospira variabilis]MCG5494049.1 MinD/ParA family protein [Ectothiorhodospira variabilis]MCG5498018.1 MinD/ParA family protein [Ectothiorhodospira variabilis]MCG5503421.1 MinD/ParA family protein [Ectothiorhodospira variabilis]MCG5506491.1 MinD/ParA family protein [Ectothiorhodospira variabilis]
MPSPSENQSSASGRRDKPRPVRVIAVSSGKGGVGKTNVSVNLCAAMARAGKHVMLMDADLGLANVDLLLGLQPKRNLSHVLEGQCSLDEVVVEGPNGMLIVPAASGIADMADLGRAQHVGIIHAFSELTHPLDVLVVDTAAGLHDSVTSFCRAAHEVLVVVCDEPASITDAYALIKVLCRDHGVMRFRILANMVRNEQEDEGRSLFRKLVAVCDRFLDDVTLDYVGSIPYDDYLRKAVQRRQSVVEAYPSSPAARSFAALPSRIEQWPMPRGARGGIEFFVERLINSDQSDLEPAP